LHSKKFFEAAEKVGIQEELDCASEKMKKIGNPLKFMQSLEGFLLRKIFHKWRDRATFSFS